MRVKNLLEQSRSKSVPKKPIEVTLFNTEVMKGGVDELQKMLPKCKILTNPKK